MLKLSIDLDDTLVSLVKPWLKWLKDTGMAQKLYKPNEVTHYRWFSDSFGEKAADFFQEDPVACYEKLRPFPGAQAFFLYCNENFDVDIVTHSHLKTTEKGKTKFVDRWFGKDIDIKFFRELADKYKSTKNSILIDDYPLHIINHIAHNKQPAILFNYKNENGWGWLENYLSLIKELKPDLNLFHFATNYKEVIDILEILKNEKSLHN